MLRIITRRYATCLVEILKASGYGITIVDGEGSHGPVKIIFTLINRKDFEAIIKLVQQYSPKAFYTVEDIRFTREGIFPAHHTQQRKFNALSWLRYERKGKYPINCILKSILFAHKYECYYVRIKCLD